MLWLIFAASASHGEENFLAPEQAFKLVTNQGGSGGKLDLNWTIAPGYYLYRDRLQVTAVVGQSLGAVVRPPGQSKVDPNFGTVEVYHDQVSLQVDTAQATSVLVTWQGCADAGLCYPPQKQTVTLMSSQKEKGNPVAADASTTSRLSLSPSLTGSDSKITEILAQRSLLWTLPLFFFMGVALAFTPCVLPMLPIISGMVVGSQAASRRAFGLSLAFVVSMAAVYALMGVVAAMAGSGLQAALQNPWMILGFAAVFVVLACSMFGFFELQLPTFLRDRLADVGPQRGGSVAGAAGLGALSALLVGPCMTAPLAGTLLYIAQSGSIVQGGLLLLSLGLGMGAPLLVLSTVGARYLPHPGAWMNRVKTGFGFVMLGTAVWMAQRVVSGPVALILWGCLLVGLAVTLWHTAFEPGAANEADSSPAPRLLLSSIAILAALWGSAMVLGAAAGGADPLRPLTLALALATPVRTDAPEPVAARTLFETISDPLVLQARLDAAKAADQSALVDYYADWCTSCKSLEKEVFGNPQVLQALNGMVLLRADVTQNDAAQRALMERHHVMGPPTVMLFDRQGRERREARLVGEFSVRDLLERRPGVGDAL